MVSQDNLTVLQGGINLCKKLKCFLEQSMKVHLKSNLTYT